MTPATVSGWRARRSVKTAARDAAGNNPSPSASSPGASNPSDARTRNGRMHNAPTRNGWRAKARAGRQAADREAILVIMGCVSRSMPAPRGFPPTRGGLSREAWHQLVNPALRESRAHHRKSGITFLVGTKRRTGLSETFRLRPSRHHALRPARENPPPGPARVLRERSAPMRYRKAGNGVPGRSRRCCGNRW